MTGHVHGTDVDVSRDLLGAIGGVPTPPTDMVVDATNVDKWFGKLHVLRDVTMTVKRQEVVVVLGPSGSGKTTFIRCVNHLEKIQSGRIFVNGHLIGYRDVNGKLVEDKEANIARQRQEIGMVFQRFNLFPHKTALENIIEAPIQVRGTPKDEAIEMGRALLTRVGLAVKEQSYPSQLSGGQQQRVALARAWALQPKVLLLDEPTASLDPHAKREVEALIEEFASQSDEVTLVFASHNLGQVKRMASRVIYLEHGRLLADLPVEDFFSGSLLQQRYQAAHLFVKGELV